MNLALWCPPPQWTVDKMIRRILHASDPDSIPGCNTRRTGGPLPHPCSLGCGPENIYPLPLRGPFDQWHHYISGPHHRCLWPVVCARSDPARNHGGRMALPRASSPWKSDVPTHAWHTHITPVWSAVRLWSASSLRITSQYASDLGWKPLLNHNTCTYHAHVFEQELVCI